MLYILAIDLILGFYGYRDWPNKTIILVRHGEETRMVVGKSLAEERMC